MTIKLDLGGLLYGLLALATIASVTSIAARLIKLFLPLPTSFDPNERHLDSRDVLADLVTSWEILPSLLNRNTYSSSYSRANSSSTIRRNVYLIFFAVAVITVATETVLILSTGTVHTDLFTPDVQRYTFLGRHLGKGIRLFPITEQIGSDKCIKNVNSTFSDRIYVEYSESLCVSEKLQRKVGPVKEFQLRTEVSRFDEVKLWFGEVELKKYKLLGPPFNKTTFAIASASVQRRVHYIRRDEKRILDKATATRMATVIAERSGCAMRSALESGELDSEVLQRPANIANYTCKEPLHVRTLLSHMGAAVLQGFSKFEYGFSDMIYHDVSDSWVVDAQRKLRVGVRLSPTYEPAWFIAMSVISLIGVLLWIWDRLWSRSVYPGIGMLSLMSEISGSDECCINEIYRSPVVLYANDVEIDVDDGTPFPSTVKRRTFLTQKIAMENGCGVGHFFNPSAADDPFSALRPQYEMDTMPTAYNTSS